MKEFLHLLAPLRRKLAAEQFLNHWLWLEGVAVILSIILTLLSKWVKIPFVLPICIVLLVLATLLAALWAFVLHKPSDVQTAEIADTLGGAERMITTLELLARTPQNDVERMAVTDGMTQAQETDFAKRYPFAIPKKLLIVFLMLSLVLLASAFVPIHREETVKIYADAQLEKIEEIKEDAKEDMTKEEQKQFDDVVDTLEKELSQAKTKEEVENAVRNAQQQMKQLEKESLPPDLQELADALSTQTGTDALSQTLSQGDAGMTADALSEALENMSEEQKQALAEQLQQAGQNMQNSEMQQATQNLSQALQQGSNLSQAAQQLGNAASAQAQQGQGLRDGLQKMNQGLANSTQQNAAPSQNGQNQDGQSQDGQSQDGQGQDGQNSQQSPNSTGEGNSQGQGQGQGDGQGQGQGQGQSQGQGQGQGSGRGEGKGNADKIYTRTAQDKQGYDAYLQGQKNENGETTISQGSGTGQFGESLPYQEVFGQYKESAIQQMESDRVPYGMRDLVSTYFSTLEKQ